MEYEIKIPRIGKTFRAGDAETILSAALRHKISLEFKCGNGSCKTCVSDLIEGTVDYPYRPPIALTEQDRIAGRMLICQAVARSDIEMDARVRTGLMEEVRLHELKTALDGIAIRQGEAVVTQIGRASHDVTIIRLEPDELPAWLPGQYLTLKERGLQRDFSISSLPGRDGFFELQIRHVPGGRFTGWVADGMRIGDRIAWEGPLGTFFHRAASRRPVLVIAGGTGFSPAQAVVESALKGAAAPVTLYWGVRAKRDLYALGTVESWLANPAFSFVPVLSDPLGDDNWAGESGFVHETVARNERSLSAFDVYIAGPPPMVDAALAMARSKGARSDRVFTDSFDFSPTAAAATG